MEETESHETLVTLYEITRRQFIEDTVITNTFFYPVDINHS